MERFNRIGIGPLKIGLLTLLLGFCCQGRLTGQTGTFIDRDQATDLRVTSFNVYINKIFPSVDPNQAAKFVRLVNALDPDILALQEVQSSSAAVVDLLNDIAPLPSGTWYAHKARNNVIASKYPLSMLATSIDPNSVRPPAIALVDLPDAQFGGDFYIIDAHYTVGLNATAQAKRQRNSDATIRWIRDALTPGGAVDLPPGTPIAVVGDLNNFPDSPVVSTLVTGDILNEGTYGPDFPPDWDGSSFTEAQPLHNGSGPEDYTYYGGFHSESRIDHIIYSDSALDVANKFVLNTVDMSLAELAATGLQVFDVTIDSTGENFDHLPVVTDFRLFEFANSDFNFSRSVDGNDFLLWQRDPSVGSLADWKANYGMGTAPILAASASVPEPSSILLLAAGAAGLGMWRKKRAG